VTPLIAYVDGAWLAEDQAAVPIGDRGFLLGDGVYDTCRVFEGAYFRFDEHAERLRASGAILRIPVPPVARLRDIAEELLGRNRSALGPAAGTLDHAGLRLTVTRGSGGTGLATAGAGPARIVATLRPMPADWRERAARGWAVITARTRHAPPDVLPPGLKGQGRVSSLLARLEADEAGADDALLLSPTGEIAEGTTWNVFWRTGQTLHTPDPRVGLLAGATRGLVLDIARDAGFATLEGCWGRDALDAADEAFATMTSLGVVPLRSLDGRTFPQVGRAAARLADLYWDRVRRENRG
jgi:branched-chain amino acid aminotransferase